MAVLGGLWDAGLEARGVTAVSVWRGAGGVEPIDSKHVQQTTRRLCCQSGPALGWTLWGAASWV